MNITETGIALSERLKLIVTDFKNKSGSHNQKFEAVLQQAEIANKWFTADMSVHALQGIICMLQPASLSLLPAEVKVVNPKNIGIICAGNIPLVAFHDLWCVLYSGHRAVLKLSGDDTVLMTFICELLCEINPGLKQSITIVERLKDADAIIATGSNNAFRYFDYYFGKHPHIFRKNRNSVALLTGNETATQMHALADDLFMYFGLGCRNISKVFVPEGYTFDFFFESVQQYGHDLLQHNKYCNNYEYHKALYLLELIPFLTNNFLIVKEAEAWSTPVSVLHYQYYNDAHKLLTHLNDNKELLQCIAVADVNEWPQTNLKLHTLGTLQKPLINDYADGINTLDFLINL